MSAKGIALPAASGQAIPAPTAPDNGQAINLVTGFAAKNSGAAAGTVELYDGTSNAGVLIAVASIPAAAGGVDGVASVDFHEPRYCSKGLYVQYQGTVTVSGSIWVV